ncbi:hypothetical protein ONS96_011777 [Cadophora gregata f. sp. sojae]|nr:hypothetical protein ONS96_011777 [Cadophora gregata f. sp. sojae]
MPSLQLASMKKKSTLSTTQDEPTFHRFPELPKELRLQIWGLTLPGPRIVRLTSAHLKPVYCLRVRSDADINTTAFLDILPVDEKTVWYSQELFTGIRSNYPPPDILAVNKESFEVVSSRYERVFGTVYGIPQTWFDFDRDFLYVDWHSDLEFVQSELRRVQNFVIDFGRYYDIGLVPGIPGGQSCWEESLALFLRDFLGARNVILNNGDVQDDYDELTKFEFGDAAALEPLFSRRHQWIESLAGQMRSQGITRGADILENYLHNRQVSLDMKKFEKFFRRFKLPGTFVLSTINISWKRVATPEQHELYRLVHRLWADELAKRSSGSRQIKCVHRCRARYKSKFVH